METNDAINLNVKICHNKRKADIKDDDKTIIHNNKKTKKHTFDANIPTISNEVLSEIKRYKRVIHKIETLQDLFSLSDNNELPNEEHEFVTLANECITVLDALLLNGFDDDDIDENDFKHNLYEIYDLFKTYRIVRYEFISELALLHKTNRASISLLCFIIESYVILIMDVFEITMINPLTVENQKKLIDCELIFFCDKNISEYNQNEIIIVMTGLCDSWNSITSKLYNDIWLIVDNYIQLIHLRIAHLFILHHSEDVLNGRDRIEKIGVSLNKFSASIEFIANMTCIISHLQTTINVRNKFHDLCRSKKMGKVDTEYWNDDIYIPYIRIGFRNWTNRTLKTLQAAKFREKIKASIYKYSIRMHESEMYSRNNGGFKNKNALSIIEQTRTPLQNAYFNLELLPSDMTSLLPTIEYTKTNLFGNDNSDDEDDTEIIFNSEYTFVGSILTCLVFNCHCESDMVFDWMSNNFIDDYDYYKYQHILEWRKEPIVVRFSSEYNVWYNNKLWLTYDIDIAILYWIVIMTTKFKSQFKTHHRIYNIKNMEDLLKTWKQDGKSHLNKSSTPIDKNDTIHQNKKNDSHVKENIIDVDLALF